MTLPPSYNLDPTINQETVCLSCNKEYGSHVGSYCPTGGGLFSFTPTIVPTVEVKDLCGFCGYHKLAHVEGVDLIGYRSPDKYGLQHPCSQFRAWNLNSSCDAEPYKNAAAIWLARGSQTMEWPASAPAFQSYPKRSPSQCKCDIKDLLSNGHTSGCAYAR